MAGGAHVCSPKLRLWWLKDGGRGRKGGLTHSHVCLWAANTPTARGGRAGGVRGHLCLYIAWSLSTQCLHYGSRLLTQQPRPPRVHGAGGGGACPHAGWKLYHSSNPASSRSTTSAMFKSSELSHSAWPILEGRRIIHSPSFFMGTELKIL